MSSSSSDSGNSNAEASKGVTLQRIRIAVRTLGSLLLGWAVIWGAVLIVGKGLVPLVDTVFRPGIDSLSAIRRAGIFLGAVSSYLAYVHWHERRVATELRLRGIPVLLGSISGAALIAVPIAMLFLLGAYELLLIRGATSGLMGIAALIIIAATLEELIFRCLLFRVLEQVWGTWAALAIQAVLFALRHLENVAQGGVADAVTMFVAVTLAGLLWAAVFILTRNLWATVANHAAWNFTIVLSGVPLSGIDEWRAMAPLESTYAGPDWLTGGVFGPESSLLVIATTTVAVVFLLREAVRRGAIVRREG